MDGLSGRSGVCAECGAPIYTVHTLDGHEIHLDPQPAEEGSVIISVRTIDGDTGREIARPETEDERQDRLNRPAAFGRTAFVVHAATCKRKARTDMATAKKTSKKTTTAKTENKGKRNIDFMRGQADQDVSDFRAKILKDALAKAQGTSDSIRKAIAYGVANECDRVRTDMLRDVGDLAGELREATRSAIRQAKAEKRNVQPSVK